MKTDTTPATATRTRNASAPTTEKNEEANNRIVEEAIEESANRKIAKAVYKAAGPTLVKVLTAVLDCEDPKLGPSRAYILADWLAVFTGKEGQQNAYMLGKRVEIAGQKDLMGRLANRVRKQFASPLHDQLKGVVTEDEVDDSEFDF